MNETMEKKGLYNSLEFKNEHFDILLNEVSELYDADKDKVFTKCRKQELISAKRMFVFILRNVYKIKLKEIGKLTGLKHPAVVHHVNTAEFYNKKYKDFRFDYLDIEARILRENIDGAINIVESNINELKGEIKVLKKELTKLYNIKSNKNVRKKRKNLLA